MPTATAVRSSIRSAGANPSSIPSQRTSPAARKQSTGKQSSGTQSTRYKGGYPGAPTAKEVREGIRSSGPSGLGDVGEVTGSRRNRSSRANRSGRSSPTSSASVSGVFEGPHTGALIAEFLLAVVMIFITMVHSSKPYAQRMSAMMWQLSSLALLFFVMALLDKGGKMSKAMVAFGAMIDLGILFVMAQNNLAGVVGQGASGSSTTTTLAAFTGAVSGQGTPVGDSILTVDTAAEPAPTHDTPMIDAAATAAPASASTAKAATAKPAAKPAPTTVNT